MKDKTANAYAESKYLMLKIWRILIMLAALAFILGGGCTIFLSGS